MAELAEQVRRKDRSAVEVVDQALAAIEGGNEALNAFVVDADLARRTAAEVAAVVRGDDPARSPACLGVKDLEDCAGLPTSHGSCCSRVVRRRRRTRCRSAACAA